MLYDRSAVLNQIKVTEKQNSLANNISKHFKLHIHNFQILEEIRRKISRAETEMGFIRGMTKTISEVIKHENQFDDNAKRPKNGYRFPDQALFDEKGHCIEINLTLYAALKQGLPGLKTKFLIGKNPKHCRQPKNIDEIGMHLMIYFELNDLKYYADAVSGCIFRYEGEKYFHANTLLSKREFASFVLMDIGEEFTYYLNNYKRGLSYVDRALIIDPNNYPALNIKSKIMWNNHMFGESERNHKSAIEIAPNLMDTWKALGDFYYDYHISKKKAKEVYREAIEKPTTDFQIAASLEERLSRLGMKQEVEKVGCVCVDLFIEKKLMFGQRPLYVGVNF